MVQYNRNLLWRSDHGPVEKNIWLVYCEEVPRFLPLISVCPKTPNSLNTWQNRANWLAMMVPFRQDSSRNRAIGPIFASFCQDYLGV